MGTFTRIAGWVLVGGGLLLTIIAFVDGPERTQNAATLTLAPPLVVAGAVLVVAGELARRAGRAPAGGQVAAQQPPGGGQRPYPQPGQPGYPGQPGQPGQSTQHWQQAPPPRG